ncbi:MAG: DHHA1 domain-containing protein, partial [Chloroflexota bacterium]
GLLKELETERKTAASLQQEISRKTAESLLEMVAPVDGIAVLAARVAAPNMEALRQMGDMLKSRLGTGVIVLGAVFDGKPNFVAMVTPDLVARGLHAGRIVKEVAAITGGSGGGRPELGQAGGKDKTKIDEALQGVVKLVQR